jgi:hypothetical protein
MKIITNHGRPAIHHGVNYGQCPPLHYRQHPGEYLVGCSVFDIFFIIKIVHAFLVSYWNSKNKILICFGFSTFVLQYFCIFVSRKTKALF